MTADAAIAEAQCLGIRLFAKEGGRLGYDAPIGKLSPELKADLVAHKPEILARLSRPGKKPSSPSITPGPRLLPWRSTVGSWPIEFRQRWGDRTNALQDDGLDWHEAERIAFQEISVGCSVWPVLGAR